MNHSLELIKNLIDNTEPGLAVFDFDNTIVRGDIGDTFIYHLVSNYLLNISDNFIKAFQTKYSPDS